MSHPGEGEHSGFDEHKRYAADRQLVSEVIMQLPPDYVKPSLHIILMKFLQIAREPRESADPLAQFGWELWRGSGHDVTPTTDDPGYERNPTDNA